MSSGNREAAGEEGPLIRKAECWCGRELDSLSPPLMEKPKQALSPPSTLPRARSSPHGSISRRICEVHGLWWWWWFSL